jgi:hypothetical protein
MKKIAKIKIYHYTKKFLKNIKMKIAYFDYWTGGIDNFTPIHNKLISDGHEVILMHIGSFNDNDVVEEEIKKDIICRDISYYKTIFIINMLKIEKPDVLLTLNTSYIIDRAVIMACKKLKIRTVFMMHGIKSFGDEGVDELIPSLRRSYNGKRKKIGKIPKYLKYVIPNYIKSAWNYNPEKIIKLKFLYVLSKYYNDFAKSMLYPPVAEELLADKCLIYTAQDKAYYQKLGYSNSSIKVVGNSKYDEIIRREKHNKKIKNNFEINIMKLSPYALYLDEALPEQNDMYGITKIIRNKTINEISHALKKRGINLIVKLHPASEIENFNIDKNIPIFNEHLDDLIYNSKFCISSSSTTIYNCAIFRKPVFSPRWGPYNNMPTWFIRKQVAKPWQDLNEELKIDINNSKYDSFCAEFIGGADGCASDRIIESLTASN